jgi:alanine racemase
MSPSLHDSHLTINLAAIGRNYTKLQRQLGKVECRAVVKADAYGLGLAQVCPALFEAGCEKFYVATLEEALTLRKLLPTITIFLLHGMLPGQAEILARNRIVPVLNDFYQIELWQAHAKLIGKKLPAALHIDTGLCRIGLEFDDYPAILAKPETLEGIEIDHVMTHLSCSRDPSHPKNYEQLLMAQRLQALWPSKPFSLSSSGGMFISPDYYFDIIRAGCSLYGIAPTSAHKHEMESVITLTSRLVQIRSITKAQPVGYGGSYMANPGDKIAVAAIGYADGYMRNLANKGYAYIGEYKAPVVGVVSMDMVALDVTHVPSPLLYPGAAIELLGPNVLFNDVLDSTSSTGYEILTRLGIRVKRHYMHDARAASETAPIILPFPSTS